MNALSDIVAQPEPVASATSMRCTVADLRRAVSLASSVVERRNTIPVLGCIAIYPQADKLTICGTDLDQMLSVECPAQCVEAFGAFTLEARQLAMLLRGAEAKESVTIQREPEDRFGDVLSIQIGPLTIRRRQLAPIADFPAMAELPDAPVIATIAEGTLRKMLDTCRPCISTEETRYYLNGIYLHAICGKVTAVATDGHRLALCRSEQDWPLPAHILPTRAVTTLANLLAAGGDKEVSVAGWTAPRMRFQGDGWTLTTRMIDGTFPDYDRVVPKPGNDSYKARAVLAPALFRRIPPGITGPFSSAAKLDLAAKTMSVISHSDGLEASLPIEAEGKISIGFNIRYLHSFTQAYGTIHLQINGSGDAAIVLSEDPEFLGVLMPMRVA